MGSRPILTITVKRLMFTGIQNSSTIAAYGYRTLPLRTGYESIVADRVGDLYAFVAEEDGKILELDESLVKVEYKSGKVKGVELGIRHGKVTGKTFPHSLVCDLSAGKKFKAGDVVAFNEFFFERDFFDRTQVNYKIGALATTVFIEDSDTLEDSCAISTRLGGMLKMPTTKARHILVNFSQEVHNLLGIGDEVNSDSILCTIEDAVTSGTDLFDEETLDSLKTLASNTPKAKVAGKVSKMAVMYNGDKADMSPTLKAIADKGDRERAKLSKRKEAGEPTNGRVGEVIRVDGNKLEMDTMIITLYIDGEEGMTSGDKTVFANMLKTVVARVMTGENVTEDGEDIDALFSYHSIAARVVLSPEIMGTYNTLLKVLSKKVAEIYRG